MDVQSREGRPHNHWLNLLPSETLQREGMYEVGQAL